MINISYASERRKAETYKKNSRYCLPVDAFEVVMLVVVV